MDKKDEINEWFQFAGKDLFSAIYLQNLSPVPVEIICYHCPQSAEKYIKGYLISKNEPVNKTHDLLYLREKCYNYDNDFSQIENECNSLNDYSVSSRYPGNDEITINDMKKAILDSKRIENFIINKTILFLKNKGNL